MFGAARVARGEIGRGRYRRNTFDANRRSAQGECHAACGSRSKEARGATPRPRRLAKLLRDTATDDQVGGTRPAGSTPTGWLLFKRAEQSRVWARHHLAHGWYCSEPQKLVTCVQRRSFGKIGPFVVYQPIIVHQVSDLGEVCSTDAWGRSAGSDRARLAGRLLSGSALNAAILL